MMTLLRSTRLSLCVLSAVALLGASVAGATPITYTFDAPIFTDHEATPILNAPPNVGPATFSTDFIEGTGPKGFTIGTFEPNGLFSGQMLGAFKLNEKLLLFFNTPVDELTFSWGMFGIPNGTPPVQLHILTGPSKETFVFTSSNQAGGGGDQGGIVHISRSPFSEVDISLFNTGGRDFELAIDNLILNAVTPDATPAPEPASLIFVVSGLAGLMCRSRRRKGD